MLSDSGAVRYWSLVMVLIKTLLLFVQVERECEGLQYQVEVRNITQRIGSLSEKLDAAGTLGEPRENAFLTCDFTHNDSYATLETALSKLGRVRTSTTFPSLCTAHLNSPAVVQLETIALLHTVSKVVSQTAQYGQRMELEFITSTVYQY
jgi:tripartite motif-containing protein 2/3